MLFGNNEDVFGMFRLVPSQRSFRQKVESVGCHTYVPGCSFERVYNYMVDDVSGCY